MFAIEDCRKGGATGAGGRVGGPAAYRLKVGVHGRTKEQMAEHSRLAGLKAAETNKENGTGIYGVSKEEKSAGGKQGGGISGIYVCHNRWHAARNRVNPDCFLCQLHGTTQVLPKAQRDGYITEEIFAANSGME
jgi:hypothetical protein